MTVNPNTGLPQLPKGYFFRVSKFMHYPTHPSRNMFDDDKVGPYYGLRLRKKRFFGLFSTGEYYEFFNASQYHAEFTYVKLARNLDEAEILRVATKLAAELYDELETTAADREKSYLVGDYPPKKIGHVHDK